jgi:hypothetical protein
MWIYERIEEEFNTLPELKKRLKKIGEDGWEITSYNESNEKSKIKIIVLVKKEEIKIEKKVL